MATATFTIQHTNNKPIVPYDVPWGSYIVTDDDYLILKVNDILYVEVAQKGGSVSGYTESWYNGWGEPKLVVASGEEIILKIK
jgi:hypothetical protein